MRTPDTTKSPTEMHQPANGRLGQEWVTAASSLAESCCTAQLEHWVLLSTIGPASLSGMQHLLQGSKGCPRIPRLHFHPSFDGRLMGMKGLSLKSSSDLR